jgi:hypothetical protein
MNQLKVSTVQYEALINLFPEAYRERLRVYTGEELYYAYRIALYEGRRNRMTKDYSSGDVFYLGLKTKLFRYLKGIKTPGAYGIMREQQPISPAAFLKIGSKFRADFNEVYGFEDAPKVSAEALDTLKNSINSKRVA